MHKHIQNVVDENIFERSVSVLGVKRRPMPSVTFYGETTRNIFPPTCAPPPQRHQPNFADHHKESECTYHLLFALAPTKISNLVLPIGALGRFRCRISLRFSIAECPPHVQPIPFSHSIPRAPAIICDEPRGMIPSFAYSVQGLHGLVQRRGCCAPVSTEDLRGNEVGRYPPTSRNSATFHW